MPVKKLKPGHTAPSSGQYVVIGPRGGRGREITVVKGEPMPPTSKPGMTYRPKKKAGATRRRRKVETRIFKSENVSGFKVVQLRSRNQLTLPNKMVKSLELEEGSPLIVEMGDEGEIRLRPVRLVPLAGTREAQQAEAQASKQIATAGRPRFRSKKELREAFDELLEDRG